MIPQLADKVTNNAHGVRLCTDDDWWCEAKVDGDRKLIVIEGEKLLRFNREGSPTDPLHQRIADWFEPFEGDWAFDCELLDDGHLVMFDLIRANGAITEDTPYYLRRTALETVYDKSFAESEWIKLVPVARTTEEKVNLSKRIAEDRGEGMMFKHVDGIYECGVRSTNTKKWKYWKTVDAIVGEVGREGKLSTSLRLFDPETHELVDIGSVATKRSVMQQLQKNDVIECRYLYVNDLETNPRLYQTTFLRKRKDKSADSCWLDQLQGTNKLAFMKET